MFKMVKKDSKKLKSAHSFEVVLWSERYYGGKKKPNKAKMNIWNGYVVNSKTGKNTKFHSVTELLKAIEKFYFQEEKKK